MSTNEFRFLICLWLLVLTFFSMTYMRSLINIEDTIVTLVCTSVEDEFERGECAFARQVMDNN
jgi:hypothetical protein